MFWQSVTFTDEKCSSSVSAPGRQCWRLKNERFVRKHIFEIERSGRVTQGMHGWMWYGGVGELVDIEGNLNSEVYINILETSFLPAVRAYAIPEPLPIYFVQDNSPIHNSRAVKQWFSNHPEIILIDWPPNGCDLNPIENLWSIMVKEWEPEEKTKSAIMKKCLEIWESIRRTPNVCSTLVNSLPSRLQKVVDAEGGWSGY